MRNTLVNLIERLFLHPKTTVAGLAIAILLWLYVTHKINSEELATTVGILVSAGLLASKDPQKQQ